MKLEDIRLFLPKYLSSESEQELFTCLKDFPDKSQKASFRDQVFSVVFETLPLSMGCR